MWCVETVDVNGSPYTGHMTLILQCEVTGATLVDYETNKKLHISVDELPTYHPLGYVPSPQFMPSFCRYIRATLFTELPFLVYPYDRQSERIYSGLEDVEITEFHRTLRDWFVDYIPVDKFYSVWLVVGRLATFRDMCFTELAAAPLEKASRVFSSKKFVTLLQNPESTSSSVTGVFEFTDQAMSYIERAWTLNLQVGKGVPQDGVPY